MLAWLALTLMQTAPVAADPQLPARAHLNPYGYEREQCSPLARPEGETLRACQNRIRTRLAAELGYALPPGLAPFAEPVIVPPLAARQQPSLSPRRDPPQSPVLEARP